MVQPKDLKDRLAVAIQSTGRDPSTSTSWLAKQLDISYNGAKKLLSGESASMKADTAARAVTALDCRLNWLLHGEGPMTEPKRAPLFGPELSEEEQAAQEEEMHREFFEKHADLLLKLSELEAAEGSPPLEHARPQLHD